MNLRLVLSVLGQIMVFEGLLMLAPLAIVLIYGESLSNAISFIAPAFSCLVVGGLLSRQRYDTHDMHAAEGFMIVALSWLALSFFGSFPFLISGELSTFADAFFETASGFSTTGATVFEDVEVVSQSILFWRSLTQWLGGMGVLVFALAIMPPTQSESVYIMKAEVPGTGFGKLKSRVTSSARTLYILYIVLTFITMVLLMFGSVPVFDAVLMAFGAAATGGFSTMNASTAHYDSIYIELVLTIAMLVFGVNFNLYYLAIHGQIKPILKNEELRWFIMIVFASSFLISLDLIANDYPVFESMKDAFFSVSSVMTTTAYVTTDYTLWPIFPRVILMALMFIGGMSGSTAGGLKVSRIAVLFKVALAEIKRLTYPNRVVSVHFEHQAQSQAFLRSVVNYFIVYMMIFVLGVAIISLEVPEFISSFSTASAMLNNIGSGFGIVGPAYNYSFFSGGMKIFLSFLMIAGRLEIYPLLILLSPNLWRRSWHR